MDKPLPLITLIILVANLLMAATIVILVVTTITLSDGREVLHDQLIIAESKLETRNEDYNRLLEKVGGADVPFTPYIHPSGPGKVGDK